MWAKDTRVPLDLHVWHQKQVTRVHTKTFVTLQRYVVVENAN